MIKLTEHTIYVMHTKKDDFMLFPSHESSFFLFKTTMNLTFKNPFKRIHLNSKVFWKVEMLLELFLLSF